METANLHAEEEKVIKYYCIGASPLFDLFAKCLAMTCTRGLHTNNILGTQHAGNSSQISHLHVQFVIKLDLVASSSSYKPWYNLLIGVMQTVLHRSIVLELCTLEQLQVIGKIRLCQHLFCSFLWVLDLLITAGSLVFQLEWY